MFPLTKNFSVGRQHGLSYKWPILASLPKATSYGVHESSCESSAYLDVLHKFMPTPSCFWFCFVGEVPCLEVLSVYLLLVLHSRFTPGGESDPIWVLGLESRSVACKESILPTLKYRSSF